MRHIVKGDSPSELETFKRKNPSKVYKDLKGNEEVKSSIQASLLNEQDHLCCYCEKSIDTEKSHIEHIKPQSQFPTETLDYDNLLASCNEFCSCGHKKAKWYSELDFIHPLHQDCDTHFKFELNGQVSGTSKAGQITINALGLNSQKLVKQRGSVLKVYRDLLKDDIRLIIQSNENKHEFISALESIFELSA